MKPTLEQLQQSADSLLVSVEHQSLDELGDSWRILQAYSQKYNKSSAEYKLLVDTQKTIDKLRAMQRKLLVPILSPAEQERLSNKDEHAPIN